MIPNGTRQHKPGRVRCADHLARSADRAWLIHIPARRATLPVAAPSVRRPDESAQARAGRVHASFLVTELVVSRRKALYRLDEMVDVA